MRNSLFVNSIWCNIVDFHTPLALRKWGSQVSSVFKFFVLVWNEKGAKFGDDVIVANGVSNNWTCIEGGTQSLRELVMGIHLMTQNELTRIRIYQNLRTNIPFPTLSAAKIIYDLSQNEENCEYLSQVQQLRINETSQEELYSIVIQRWNESEQKPFIFDPVKGDAETKKDLYIQAQQSIDEIKVIPNYLTFLEKIEFVCIQ
jgi:hypothetical protein